MIYCILPCSDLQARKVNSVGHKRQLVKLWQTGGIPDRRAGQQLSTNGRLMSIMALLCIFTAAPWATIGHHMNACDCSGPYFVGVMILTRFLRWEMPPKETVRGSPVSYRIFQHKATKKMFYESVCQQWVTGIKGEHFGISVPTTN